MTFLNSIWLWGGLAAAGVAVPIVIHLFNRYRHRRVQWAAMDLLRRAMTVRSRQVRLEDVLLLLLRCLAIALIAFALVRPTVLGAGARWIGGEGRVGAVIAVDGSYSMATRGVQSQFDAARSAAEAVGRTLRPGDAMTVVLMGDRPRVLVRNVGYDEEHLANILAAAEPLPEGLNLEAGLEGVRGLLDEMRVPAKELYLVTDAQADQWEDPTAPVRETIDALAGEANVMLLPVGGAGASPGGNLTVEDLRIASGSALQGSVVRVLATVANTGATAASGVQLNLMNGETPVDSRTLDRLDPGERVTVPLFLATPTGDAPADEENLIDADGRRVVRLTATLPEDALTLDNRRYLVARLRPQLRVLLVDGDPTGSPEPMAFMRKALSPGSTEGIDLNDRGLIVDTVPLDELPAVKLETYHAVVLNRAGAAPGEATQPLGRYVEAGGGLMVVLGAEVGAETGAGAVNTAYEYRPVEGEPRSLLPATVREAVMVAGGGTGGGTGGGEMRIMPEAASANPAAEAARLLPESLMSRATLRRITVVEPAEGAGVVLRAVGQDADHPLLVTGRLGAGRVMLLTASLGDRSVTDLGPHPLFPILMHQAVGWLADEDAGAALTVGDPASLTVPTSVASGASAASGGLASVGVVAPDGGRTETGAEVAVGGGVVRVERVQMPGFYEVADGDRLLDAVAVNVDATESASPPLTPAQVEASLRGLPVAVLRDAADVAGFVEQSRTGTELWWPLLAIGLGLLAVESLLATWFSRRMRGSAADVGETARPRSWRRAQAEAAGVSRPPAANAVRKAA